ncbi:MAG: ACT domain-containing protein [Kiritimatiellae bacterium]|nr:ACT domain-containing protein [Kiritimatiellia bacterium]
MKLHQISVFLENQPGRLTKPCDALANAGINILTLSLADTQNFGILRIIVEDWEKAFKVLEKSGAVVKITEVVAVKVPDRSGGFAGILHVLERSGINIDYMYAFTTNRGGNSILILRFDKADEAIEILRQSGIGIVDKISMFAR